MAIKHYSALGTINAPRRRKMTVADLKAALDDPLVAKSWRSHLRALFEEVSPRAVGRIIQHEQIDPQKLLALADEVEPHANLVQPYLAKLI